MRKLVYLLRGMPYRSLHGPDHESGPSSLRGTLVCAGLVLLAVLISSLPARGDEPVKTPALAPVPQFPTADEGTAFLERMQRAFESLVERIGPAVVAIGADRAPAGLAGDTAAAPADWSSTGSGVIIRQDGMILTSQHVIDEAMAIRVTLHDGRHYRAAIIAADRRSDLAVLRIDVTGLAVAILGDVGGVRRGHIVLALGNPFGLAGDGQAAVSQGLVSAIGRPLPLALGRDEDRYYGDMIQFSAAVGPGHSGGPLVDIRGRVIGVVTALGKSVGKNQGAGFAVPIGGHTRTIIEGLLSGRNTEYGYLGVQVGTPTGAQVRAAGLDHRHGAILDAALAGGPADRSGLRSGDIVVAVDGTDVQSADHLIRVIGGAGPGQAVDITFVRDGQRRSVTLELARRRPPAVPRLPARTVTFRGATLGEIDPAMNEWSNLPGPALLVLMVNDGSASARAGLTPGDIIVRIDGLSVSTEGVAGLGGRSGDVLLGLANGASVLVKAGP